MSDPALRPSRRYLTMVVASLSLIVLSCIAFLVPVPYVTMRPGLAFDTLGEFDGKTMFTFGEDAKTYPTDGHLRFTTVSVTSPKSRISLAQAVEAFFEEDVAVVPRSIIYPAKESAEDSEARSRAQFASSRDASRVAALRAADFTVSEAPTVVEVVKNAPAVGRLRKGDIIRTVDGQPTKEAGDVVASVGRTTPGETLTIGFTRGGKSQTVEIESRANPENPQEARIGVLLRPMFDFPIEIDNNVGERIGGSSAGTMFALAIYDRLTPGALTGGLDVAGTGTVTPDGVAGPIGGIRQKIAGAAESGSDVFLVPAANCAEAANGGDHGMQLVKISNLDDAIESLQALAKDPKASVPQCQ